MFEPGEFKLGMFETSEFAPGEFGPGVVCLNLMVRHLRPIYLRVFETIEFQLGEVCLRPLYLRVKMICSLESCLSALVGCR